MLFAKLEPKIQDIGANGFAMADLQLGTKWECGGTYPSGTGNRQQSHAMVSGKKRAESCPH